MELTTWMRFVLAVLAAWRVTHLLASEDGPADLIVRIRRRLGESMLGTLMDCFQCMSMWVAAPLAFFVGRSWIDRSVAWLAISGAACLLERLGAEPVVIQQLKEEPHGVLQRTQDEDEAPVRTTIASE